jgi:hypothetical protein
VAWYYPWPVDCGILGGMSRSRAALLLVIGLVSPLWALPSAVRPDVVPPLWGRWRVVRQEHAKGPELLIGCGGFGWEYEFGPKGYCSSPPPWYPKSNPERGRYWINQSTKPWTLKLEWQGALYIWKIEGRYLYIIEVYANRDWVPLSFEISDGTFNLKDYLEVLVRVK